MAEKPTARAVKGHLDQVRRQADHAMACVWGAVQGTAPADRWGMAADHLRAASEALAKAQEALAAMEKQEAFCAVCGEPVLHLTAGWSHFSEVGRGVERRDAGHEPELDWRQAGGASGG
jgi:hypothetical protein